MNDDAGREARAKIRAVIIGGGASEAQAEVILKRIGARLEGYTHAEAVAMYPDAP